jgi:hypothetical protein
MLAAQRHSGAIRGEVLNGGLAYGVPYQVIDNVRNAKSEVSPDPGDLSTMTLLCRRVTQWNRGRHQTCRIEERGSQRFISVNLLRVGGSVIDAATTSV